MAQCSRNVCCPREMLSDIGGRSPPGACAFAASCEASAKAKVPAMRVATPSSRTVVFIAPPPRSRPRWPAGPGSVRDVYEDLHLLDPGPLHVVGGVRPL